MALKVKIFSPNTDGLLNTNAVDTDVQRMESDTHQDGTSTIGILGTYVPDLRKKCVTFIQSIVSETRYTEEVFRKNGLNFSKEILEAVHKFSLVEKVQNIPILILYQINLQANLEQNHVLRKAMMLHAMHYFIKQSLTIDHTAVKTSAEDSSSSSSQSISLKSLSRQVKHAMLVLIRENTKKVMEGLESHMTSIPKDTVSWAIAFSVMLILCLCIDEIPATISSIDEAFPLRVNLEHERVEVSSSYANVERHLFRVVTTVFHQAYRTKLMNPLKDNQRVSTKYGFGEHGVVFLAEIRRLIEFHSRHSASKPCLGMLTHIISRNWSIESPRSAGFR
jgi:hypothetical protein